MAKGTSFFRNAGLSYLQYVSITSSVVRSSLKEPAKSRALARGALFYNKTIGDVKTPVTTFIPK